MHTIWKMNRGRVFFATAGGKALSSLAKPQLGAHSKWEQVAAADRILWMHRSLVACTPYFCRSFSAESIEISNDGVSQSKLKRILAVCEGKSWNADIEEALGGLSKELSKTLVCKVVQKMKPVSAKEFFRWARKQEGYKHSQYSQNILFRKCLYTKKFETALEVLEEMKEYNVPIDSNSFITLAFYYVKYGMMTEAEETINLMESFGFSPSPRLYRILFTGYLLASDEEGADRLLQNFSRVQDFNSALSAYARAGKPEPALKVLESMKKSGCLANMQTYNLLAKCLCTGNMIKETTKFLDSMQEKGFLLDDNLYDALISHLFEEKRVDEALKLVSHAKDNGCRPNIKTHNILIQGYFNSGQTEKAHLHLEKMKADGCTPTLETLKLFNTPFDKTEEVEKDMLKLPPKSPEIVGEVSQQPSRDERQYTKWKRILGICKGNSWDADTEKALSEYSKEFTPELVHKLLQSMEADMAQGFFIWLAKQKGYAHSKRNYSELFENLLRAGKLNSAIEVLKEIKNYMGINPIAFTLLIQFYGKAGMMTKAEEAVELMRTFDLNPDAKLYHAYLNGYLQASDDESAARLVQSFSDVENFNTAISAYARAGKADSALKVLEIMETNGCPANVQTYDLLVRCLCTANMLEEALAALKNMQEKDLAPDVKVYNTLISCLCTANMLEEALTALENMQEKGLAPDVQVYNTLISYFCQKERVDEALKLVTKMKKAGCQPDIMTHNSLIEGYLKLRQVDKAHQHMEEMEAENNHKLHPHTCSSLLKGLIKEGKLEEALKIFERTKEGAWNAYMGSYVVLLRGCCNLSQFDAINQLLADVRDKNLQLPTHTYVVLLQTYSRANKFKEVAALFGELQKGCQHFGGTRTATAVLDALSRAHELDLGVRFCEKLAESGVKLNERQLKYFLRLLVRIGRACEANELMKGLWKKGCVVPQMSELQITN